MADLKPLKIEINSMRTTLDAEEDPLALDFVLTISHPMLVKEQKQPVLDANGQPLLDADGNPVMQTISVPITRTVYCHVGARLGKAAIFLRLRNRVQYEWLTWLKEIVRDNIQIDPAPTGSVKPNTIEELVALLGVQTITI